MPRLPELNQRESLPPDALRVYDEIMAARGNLANSYAVMLHAPELVERIVQLATNLRFQSSLSRLTLELVAVTTCGELDNPYELAVHRASAIAAGIPEPVFEAITQKADLPSTGTEIYATVEFVRELVRTKQLSNASFAAARSRFGDRGVVEFLGAVGMYSMLSLMQNALQARIPESTVQPGK